MPKLTIILKTASLLLVLSFLAFSLAGCIGYLGIYLPGSTTKSTSGTSGQPTATTNSPTTTDPLAAKLTWRGRIVEVDPGGRSFLALVDEAYQTMLGDKAWVSLYEEARVVRDDTGEAISLLDVPPGSEVIVTITGGIRESYPVQVSAVEVRVVINKCLARYRLTAIRST